ncbi:unnamed protein product [Chrysoparadoxa australica]
MILPLGRAWTYASALQAQGPLGVRSSLDGRLPVSRTSRLTLSTELPATSQVHDTYDTIVVGSGNGACGFLSECYKNDRTPPKRVLVLEAGPDFFSTSDVSHQDNWTKSYSEKRVFRLFKAVTEYGAPIISGRAVCMGGGGSINYTMIHESSTWLVNHLGNTMAYWDDLKESMNHLFNRRIPTPGKSSKVTQLVTDNAAEHGFGINTDYTRGIPNLEEEPHGKEGLISLFPTQFNVFGQRVHSGVSLVNWKQPNLSEDEEKPGPGPELRTRTTVTSLLWEESTLEGQPVRCRGVKTQNTLTGEEETIFLAPWTSAKGIDGKVILCSGAVGSSRLLWKDRGALANPEIGQHLTDHIVIPLGIYLAKPGLEITGRDTYVPLFATSFQQDVVANWDFFSGAFRNLIYLVSHFFLAFLPNIFKKLLTKSPEAWFVTTNTLRWLLDALNFFLVLFAPTNEIELVTSIVKFNPAVDGCLTGEDGDGVTLGFFADVDGKNPDKELAKRVIKEKMKFISSLGAEPPLVVKFLIRLITGIPYTEKQVDGYVERYSKHFLLSEQHIAGGLVRGKASDWHGKVRAPSPAQACLM